MPCNEYRYKCCNNMTKEYIIIYISSAMGTYLPRSLYVIEKLINQLKPNIANIPRLWPLLYLRRFPRDPTCTVPLVFPFPNAVVLLFDRDKLSLDWKTRRELMDQYAWSKLRFSFEGERGKGKRLISSQVP